MRITTETTQMAKSMNMLTLFSLATFVVAAPGHHSSNLSLTPQSRFLVADPCHQIEIVEGCDGTGHEDLVQGVYTLYTGSCHFSIDRSYPVYMKENPDFAPSWIYFKEIDADDGEVEWSLTLGPSTCSTDGIDIFKFYFDTDSQLPYVNVEGDIVCSKGSGSTLDWVVEDFEIRCLSEQIGGGGKGGESSSNDHDHGKIVITFAVVFSMTALLLL